MTICQTNRNHLITIKDIDSNNTIGTRAAIFLKTSFFNYTILGTEHDIMVLKEFRIIEFLNSQECVHIIIRLNIKHILYSTTLRVFSTLRYFINFQPIATSLLCEEEHRIVHRCRINIFGEVLITCLSTFATNATSTLLFEFSQRSTFDITQMTDRDNYRIICIEILWVKFLAGINYFSTTRITIFILYLNQLILNNLFTKFRIRKNLLEICDLTF